MTDQETNGLLQVRAYTAGGAYPVGDAVVQIRREDGGGVLYSLRTDSSGVTRQVALPTLPEELSEQPGSVKPYTSYVVTVLADGYYPVTVSGVSVFENVRATLPVELVPRDSAYTRNTGGGIYE